MKQEIFDKVITRAIHFIATNTKDESYSIGQNIIEELKLVKNLTIPNVIHFKKGDNTASWRINVEIKQIIKNLKLDEFIESDSQQFENVKTLKQVATKDFDIYIKVK